MSLWQITSSAVATPVAERRDCHCASRGGTNPPERHASPAAGAQLGQHVVSVRHRREGRLTLDEREHLPPAVVAAERPRRPVEADELEVPQ